MGKDIEPILLLKIRVKSSKDHIFVSGAKVLWVFRTKILSTDSLCKMFTFQKAPLPSMIVPSL
jgi:hypothetical protein